MNDEPQPLVNLATDAPTTDAGTAAQPERDPFWSYSDLLLFLGAAIPCMLLGWGAVKLLFAAFRIRAAATAVELLPEQLLGYILLFGALALILRVGYNRPFWRSLAWNPVRMPFLWIVICGLFCAIAVALLGSLIRTPTAQNPMSEMMEDRTSAILMALFGTTVAPLAEELAFRGFLQPLLVRSLGAVAGILMASVPFGFLHFHEYGNSWRHALLIGLAGASFGWMRHATGSTRASTIMHAAYNGLIFFVVFTQGKHLLHR